MRALQARDLRWLGLLAVISASGALMARLAAMATEGSYYLTIMAVWFGVLAVLSTGAVLFARRTADADGARAERRGGTAARSDNAAAAGKGVPRQKVGFSDIAGLGEVMADLQELVTYIKDRDRFLAMDARLPRGVLLYGPPGTGKTLVAKALACEAGASFFFASGSSFVEKYVGVGAQRVRDLFNQARKQAPAIVFVDEIDSLGRSRGGQDAAEWDSALNQLLTELDGFDTDDNVLLVAATNRKDILDEALLRPGRLDRQLYIGLPDAASREAILKVHTRKKPLEPEVDLSGLARRTPGLAGAHLAAMANEAALNAARAKRTQISMADFEEALERLLAGMGTRSGVLSEHERRMVAYHEAGHAITGWALGQGVIERITILPRSAALGYVLQIPEERALHTRGALLNRIAVSLAGRAAEMLVFGDVSTGASDDLRKATAIAEQMVCEWGMSKARPNQVVRQQELVMSRDVSGEVDAIIREGWELAMSLLTRHRGAMERLTATLLERESLDRAAVEQLLGSVAA